MRKSTRTVTLILAHAGLIVSILYLIGCLLNALIPGFPPLAYRNFFLFDYGYLIVRFCVLRPAFFCRFPRPNRSAKKQ